MNLEDRCQYFGETSSFCFEKYATLDEAISFLFGGM
jgi:hypothetical protein